jgi:solute carrier family 6 GABA transporter-like protein 6/8/11/12/13
MINLNDLNFNLFQAIWAFSIYDYKTPTYNKQEYPAWAVALGWCIAATSLVPIPLFALIQIVKAKSNRLFGVSLHC